MSLADALKTLLEGINDFLEGFIGVLQSAAKSIRIALRSKGAIYAENPEDHLDRYEQHDGFWRTYVSAGGDELDIRKGEWLVCHK